MSNPQVKDQYTEDLKILAGDNKEALEYNYKKKEIEKDIISSKFEQMQERKAEIEALKSFDLDNEDPAVIQRIAEENEDYLLKAKNAKVFINNDFKGKVPLFPRNVILVAAETGVGKSTICANLAYHAILQGQRVLIIVNEENPGDVYNRITCLIKGWAYVNHSEFTDEQRKVFKEMTVLLSEKVTVVGDNRGDLHNLTTSIEGIETVLNSVVNKKSKFDLIMVDYYQNIDKSTAVPSMLDWQAQYRFCKYIDQYKNKSNAAIVVLAQLKASGGENKMSFKDSIEGRKSIMNICTCAMKVIKDVENQRTGFEIVKSRFTESLGQTVWVGFQRGKYVDYTPEFRNQVQLNIVAKATQRAVSAANPGGFNEEND